MNDFLQGVALEILVPLLSALVTMGVAFLVAKMRAVLNETKNEKVEHHLTIAMDTIAAAVEMVNQTFVDELKTQGRFDTASAKEALTKAIDATQKILPMQTKDVLKGAYDDLDLWIKAKTEEYVRESKTEVVHSPQRF